MRRRVIQIVCAQRRGLACLLACLLALSNNISSNFTAGPSGVVSNVESFYHSGKEKCKIFPHISPLCEKKFSSQRVSFFFRVLFIFSSKFLITALQKNGRKCGKKVFSSYRER